jgi:hypothetical protein
MTDQPENALVRPPDLGPEAQKVIVEALAEGNYLDVACDAAGASYHTYRHWEKRWEDGEADAQKFAGFFRAAREAVAVSERNALGQIHAEGTGWRAAAWFLERRFSDRWGKKDAPPPADLSRMSEEQLRAIAKGKGGR